MRGHHRQDFKLRAVKFMEKAGGGLSISTVAEFTQRIIKRQQRRRLTDHKWTVE
jgi:hypothetical protein